MARTLDILRAGTLSHIPSLSGECDPPFLLLLCDCIGREERATNGPKDRPTPVPWMDEEVSGGWQWQDKNYNSIAMTTNERNNNL